MPMKKPGIKKGMDFNVAAYYGAAAAPAAFSIAAVGQLIDNSTKVTYFSSVAIDFGPPDPTRVLVALIPSRQVTGYNNVTSVTFSTTPGVFSVRTINGAVNGAEIWYASVPNGSSGVTSVVFSSNGQSRAAMQVYSLIAPGTAAPFATAVSSDNQPAANITIPAGGAAIGGAFAQTGGPTNIVGSPTGFDIVDLNNNITGSQQVWSMHSSAGAVVGSTTLRMTLSSSVGAGIASVFASWGP